MKRILLICLIGVASVQVALAQHFISLSGEFGEHSWAGDLPTVAIRSSLGLGAGAGVNYELKYRHFLFSVGAAGHYSRSTFLSPQLLTLESFDGDVTGHTSVVDGAHGNFLYVYDFYKRNDTYQNVTLQVPLMFGGTWERFYFLLGAKLESQTLFGTWQAKAEYNSYGDYDAIVGRTLAHMPEYGFFDEEVLEQEPADAYFHWNVLASAEVGAWIRPEQKYSFSRAKVVYRVGAYIDCGVLDSYDYSHLQEPFVTPVYNAATPATMKDVELVDLLSTEARCGVVLPVELGVKFTVMFALPTKRPCVLCQDDTNVPSSTRKGGRIATDKKKK